MFNVITVINEYLASIMDNSVIMCDEVIESYDEETNFNEKLATCKTQNYYILLAFFTLLSYFTFITDYSIIDSC